MAMLSSWKVKAVRNLVVATCCFLFYASFAQSQRNSLQRKVSFAFENVKIENILRHLERTTDLRFVYSSDKVELAHQVSLVVYERPVSEVLGAISKQFNLEFKAQDRYVTIRQMTPPLPAIAPVASNKRSAKKTNVGEAVVQFAEPPKMLALSDEAIGRTALHNLISETTFSPDTTFLNHLMLSTTVNTQHKQRMKWFVSAGLFANDYSGGSEIRAGIQPLYAVFNAGILEGGYLRKGYGLGAALTVAKKFSINPIYTIADLKLNKDISNVTYGIMGKHHQFKLMFQYAVSKNLTLMAGPAFNSVRSTYKVQRVLFTYDKSISYSASMNGMVASNAGDRIHQNVTYPLPHHQSFEGPVTRPSDFQLFKSWVGFEFGISYSLNFSQHK